MADEMGDGRVALTEIYSVRWKAVLLVVYSAGQMAAMTDAAMAVQMEHHSAVLKAAQKVDEKAGLKDMMRAYWKAEK